MYISELIRTLEQFPPNTQIVMGDDWNAPLIDSSYLTAIRGPLVLGTVRQAHLEATPREPIAA